MKTEKDLIAKYKEYGFLSDGGELYLSIKCATRYISECTLVKLAVIDMEFFHVVSKNQVQPSVFLKGMDCDDFLKQSHDWHEIVLTCNRLAHKIIEQERENETLFCIITALDEREWLQNYRKN